MAGSDKRNGGATPWLAFLVGVLLMAAIGFFAFTQMAPQRAERDLDIHLPAIQAPSPAPVVPPAPAPVIPPAPAPQAAPDINVEAPARDVDQLQEPSPAPPGVEPPPTP
jgi:predicted lipid-binding transport protein (Tim44 family)